MYPFPLFDAEAKCKDPKFIEWILLQDLNNKIDVENYKDKKCKDYFSAIIKTQEISNIYISGSNILYSSDLESVNKETFPEIFDIVKHFTNVEVLPEEMKYIKKIGRIDDAHTSRFHVVLDSNNKKVWKISPLTISDAEVDESIFIKSFNNNKTNNNLLTPERSFFEYKGFAVAVSELISPTHIASEQKEISVYSSLFKEESQISRDIPKYSYNDWKNEYLAVLDRLMEMNILFGSTIEYISYISTLKSRFAETMRLNHGDPKIHDHVLISDDKIYILDLERMLYSTRFFDSARLAVVTERLGFSYLLPKIYADFKIVDKDDIELHVAMELFLKLREIMRVFDYPLMHTSSVSKVREKKFRDFEIFENSIRFHLKRLNISLEIEGMHSVFSRYGIKID